MNREVYLLDNHPLMGDPVFIPFIFLPNVKIKAQKCKFNLHFYSNNRSFP